MAINIKNEETSTLIRELAEVLGTSMTAAVHEAVTTRLEQARTEANCGEDPVLDKMRWIARDAAARVEATGGRLRVDDLYDEQGLPA